MGFGVLGVYRRSLTTRTASLRFWTSSARSSGSSTPNSSSIFMTCGASDGEIRRFGGRRAATKATKRRRNPRHLDDVEGVGAEVGREGRLGGDGGLLDAELLGDNLLQLSLDVRGPAKRNARMCAAGGAVGPRLPRRAGRAAVQGRGQRPAAGG